VNVRNAVQLLMGIAGVRPRGRLSVLAELLWAEW
jgi:hypothetical protein